MIDSSHVLPTSAHDGPSNMERNIKNTSIKYVCCNGRHISQLIKHPFLLLLPFNNLLSVLISAFYSLIFTKSFFFLVSCYKNVDILSYCAKNAYLGVVYIALNYNAFFLIGYNKNWILATSLWVYANK